MLLQSYTLTWSAKSLFQPTIGTSKYKALIGKSLKRSITHPTVKHRLYNWLNVIKIKHFQSFAILKSGCRRGTIFFERQTLCFRRPIECFQDCWSFDRCFAWIFQEISQTREQCIGKKWSSVSSQPSRQAFVCLMNVYARKIQ